MQNLTARRCQHVGCFTAANFGVPGDKPRFCLAHSTEDMVNRNKPRGGEGMVMTGARSLRCTTKAINIVYGGNNTDNKESGMFETDAQASEGSTMVGNCPVSGGKGILMHAVRSTSGGDCVDVGYACEPLSPRTLTNARSRRSGRTAVTSVVNDSPVPSMALTSREYRSIGVISQTHSLSSMPVLIPMDPWESVSGSRRLCRTGSAVFISRGDGIDGPSTRGPEEKPPGDIFCVDSGRNGRCMRSGNGEEDHGPATVPREPSRHDEFIVAHRVETDDFKKNLSSNKRDVPGGVPDRRGVVNTPFNVNFAGDVGNSGDIMNGGGPSFFMDGLNSLDDGDEMDSDMGFQIGATLEEILGVEQDDVKTDVFDSEGSHEQEPLLRKCSHPSVNGSAMLSSAGLSLNRPLPTADSVIRDGVELSLESCWW